MMPATVGTVERLGFQRGVQEEEHTHGWLHHVVRRTMRRALAKARAKREAGAYAGIAPEQRARQIIRWACVKTAVGGVLSGLVSTVATVVTAETEGATAAVALPLATVVAGGEMVARTMAHVDLAVELGDVFDVELDEEEIVRLMSLAVGAASDKADPLGRSDVKDVTVDREEMFKRAANLLLGETVLKNLLPIIGIASSAASNVVMTSRIGHAVRRSVRYERALRDAAGVCAASADLLIEGLWFVFTADGRLSPEETATLAGRLDDLSHADKAEILSRFTTDERNWLERVASVPDELRDEFMRALEVAAALDKEVGLPEEKILGRAASALGREYDAARVRRLVDSLEETGVMRDAA